MAFIPAVAAAITDMIEIEEDDGKSPVIAIHRLRQVLGRPGCEAAAIKFRKEK
jgi:hypothetical protein